MIRTLTELTTCYLVVQLLVTNVTALEFDEGFDVLAELPLDTDGDFIPDTTFPFVGTEDVGPNGSDTSALLHRLSGATLDTIDWRRLRHASLLPSGAVQLTYQP